MDKLTAAPLFYIFFIYGMSFLLMSYLVMKGALAATSSPLVAAFYLLALFGLTHGITEMTDWVRFILKTLGTGEVKPLTYLSQTFLIASFVLLMQFGTNLLTIQSSRKTVLRSIPLVLFGAFCVAVIAIGMADILKIGLLARYSFGFTGSVLSAIALVMSAQTMKPLGNRKLVNGLNVAAGGFACYALFGGLIVKPIAGVPIQLFRSACAVTIALSSFAVIDVYKYVKTKREMTEVKAAAMAS